GGWITSASDLVKFAAAFDMVNGKTRSGLLTPETVKLMYQPHAEMRKATASQPAQSYGLGWMLKGEGSKLVASHGGALACTASLLLHFPDGINLAVLTNLGKM